MRVGITGHRELSAPAEAAVRAALRAELGRLAADGGGEGLVAVSCLADGPDAWLAESVLAGGGRLEAVIPAADYRQALPETHRDTLDGLLGRATAVHRTGLATAGSSAYMAAGELLVGLVDVLIAVWDGRPARGLGGTGDVVACARRHGVPVRVVWPPGVRRGVTPG
ncbi:hypothetical protein [Streptomyces sp. MP131-18]|uniref:hypothetical protein n=1 Tax=Streptomyces sp. MP131-18 TaxID=1857892 RepID=UPI00097C8C5A|nr:hypothetical protein [Streptomyces sp. MP131-18]ONK12660.1 hypothetical protein STBA_34080 [Streptomyces sp. MP131-18]